MQTYKVNIEWGERGCDRDITNNNLYGQLLSLNQVAGLILITTYLRQHPHILDWTTGRNYSKMRELTTYLTVFVKFPSETAWITVYANTGSLPLKTLNVTVTFVLFLSGVRQIWLIYKGTECNAEYKRKAKDYLIFFTVTAPTIKENNAKP